MKVLKRLGALAALMICATFVFTACGNSEHGKYKYGVNLDEYLDGKVPVSVIEQLGGNSSSFYCFIKLDKVDGQNRFSLDGSIYSSLPLDQEVVNLYGEAYNIRVEGTYEIDGEKITFTADGDSAVTYSGTIKDGVISMELFAGETFEFKLEE